MSDKNTVNNHKNIQTVTNFVKPCVTVFVYMQMQITRVKYTNTCWVGERSSCSTLQQALVTCRSKKFTY